MTKEQKIEWLRNASAEELLKQYETSARWANDPFEFAKHFDGKVTIENIIDDYHLAKEEVIRRMTK